MPELPARHQVPWITQYATPSLIAAIAYEGHPAAEDPGWRESGAPDGAAYGRWCTRWCGMACLRMALIARDGHAPSLFALLDGCLDYGGYVEEPDGRVTGLLYQQFSDFTRDRYQLQADIITDLGPGRMIRELDQGRLLMASVHKEIRRPDRDPPGTGGHLVLVTGYAGDKVTFHNPSGHARQAGRHRHVADESLRPFRGAPRNGPPRLGTPEWRASPGPCRCVCQMLAALSRKTYVANTHTT